MVYGHYYAAAALAAALLVSRDVPAQSFAAPPAACWARDVTTPTTDSAMALGRRVATARRITGAPPHIDGRLDEPDWCASSPASDFVQSRPRPGMVATLPTVVRVLYDDAAVYVALRMSDPRPDSIQAPYPRRDDETTSDWVFVEIDSRHDHRSGYSFGLNPRGVQVDGLWSDDVNYDPAWNGVWEGAARIDSAGWTAEFRIPFSQMALGRSAAGGELTFGLNVYRTTPHRGETSNWSPRLPTVLGVVSRFNDLTGLVVPPQHVTTELVPYAAMAGVGGGTARSTDAKTGADVRLRPTPNTSMALTIHPDFGQVEADPSQVNLTTFEPFLTEQRPFFVEGSDIFQFNSALQFDSRGTSFDEESPFYSRRIGAPPHGGVPANASMVDIPSATTLLGAARASGRTADGWSGGVFQGETASTFATDVDSSGAKGRTMVEPLTHFSAVRGVREFADGQGAIGGMATLVVRSGMDAGMDSVLVRNALVAGMDGRRRFANGTYDATAFVLASRLEGSPLAIRAERAQPRHGYERADSAGRSPLLGDTTHGALDGVAAQVALARVGGRWKWGVAGRVVTPGFESNDVGFQRNANWILATANWSYERFLPGSMIRHWSAGSQQLGEAWTFSGDRRAAVSDITGAFDLRNYWGGTLSVDHEFAALDPEVLRNGPSLLLPPSSRWSASLYSDTRKRWQLTLGASGVREPGTNTNSAQLSPGLTAFITDRLQLGLTPSYTQAGSGWQYVAQPTDATGQVRYVLGALDQKTASLTTRATYAFSQLLTIQTYAQAFASGGSFGQFLEVADARAANIADRVVAASPARLQRAPDGANLIVDSGGPTQFSFADPAFSRRTFNLNALLRYEYSPGSTLFIIWTQERLDSDLDVFGVGRDARLLWRAPANQALLVKISYWLTR